MNDHRKDCKIDHREDCKIDHINDCNIDHKNGEDTIIFVAFGVPYPTRIWEKEKALQLAVITNYLLIIKVENGHCLRCHC